MAGGERYRLTGYLLSRRISRRDTLYVCVCQGGWGHCLVIRHRYPPKYEAKKMPQQYDDTTIPRARTALRQDTKISPINDAPNSITRPIDTAGVPAHYLEMPPRHYLPERDTIVEFRNLTYIQNLTEDNRDPSHLAAYSLRGKVGRGERRGRYDLVLRRVDFVIASGSGQNDPA
jgi:hypothetical protein